MYTNIISILFEIRKMKILLKEFRGQIIISREVIVQRGNSKFSVLSF